MRRSARVDDAPTPHFAESYPESAELEPALRAFARGDYARVNALVATLRASPCDDAVRRAAEDLAARTRPDAGAVALVLATAAALVALAAYWLTHAPRAPH